MWGDLEKLFDRFADHKQCTTLWLVYSNLLEKCQETILMKNYRVTLN